MKEHKIVRAIPLDDNCFATHEKECEGVGLKVYVTEDKYVVVLRSLQHDRGARSLYTCHDIMEV
mgnify:CR=1 FL=1